MVICISLCYRMTFPNYLNLKDFISEEPEEVRNSCICNSLCTMETMITCTWPLRCYSSLFKVSDMSSERNSKTSH